MKIALCLSLCIAGSLGLAAAEATSALSALKSLPPEAASRLAMIDGHDGSPVPERWHFLIQDPTAPNGLREYVVTNREIVADREVSQFATQLSPAEVVDRTAIKIDSTAVGRLVQKYAEANQVPVASMNFRMKKDELTGQPVWVVACTDAQGAGLATLVVDGNDGAVLGHEGFAVAPAPVKSVTKAAPLTRLARRDDPDRWSQEDPPPVYEGPRNQNRRTPVRRTETVRRSHPAPPDPINLLRRLLPF
jgi:hypothetical protein